MKQHKLTVHLELGVELEDGMRPERLVGAVDDYLGDGLARVGEARQGKLVDGVKLKKLPVVTGVVVRDESGTALVQTGSTIKNEGGSQ